jgi:hypothetical protein
VRARLLNYTGGFALLVGVATSCGRAETTPWLGHGSAGEGQGGGADCVSVVEDRDGDGVYGDAPRCVEDGVPPPFEALRDDCNDDDASVYRWVYEDLDGDGFGTARICGGALKGDFATSDGDCDDTDDAIFPGASDQWQDGVDADCDGNDGPFDCERRPDACGCPQLREPIRVEVDPSCDRALLALESLEQCFVCDDPAHTSIVIANRGALAADDISVEVRLNGIELTALTLAQSLEPGSTSLPLNVRTPHGALTIAMSTSTPTCDDAAGQLQLVRYDCYK